MTQKRKNAGKGFGMMFHGNFKSKKEAKRKERESHGFIKRLSTPHGTRYMVMSERKNPIKRKNKELKYNESYAVERDGRIISQFFQKKVNAKRVAKELGGKVIKVKPGDVLAGGVLASRNPHELLVMGANPEHGREITVPPGSTITIRMNPTDANPDRYTSAHAIASGITRQAPGLIQTKRQRKVAGMVRKARKHKYDWIPYEGIAPGQNPSAAAIREDFTGSPVERERVRHEPHMPAGDYAQLGKLLSLYVKPRRGGQVLEIRPKGVIVVSDESARQIWFVGGDQDVTEALEQFGPLARGAGLYELGEARRIDYEQRKEHVKDPDQDQWRHEFGEETGVRPTALFDANHRRLLLEGGAYEIRREGIVN